MAIVSPGDFGRRGSHIARILQCNRSRYSIKPFRWMNCVVAILVVLAFMIYNFAWQILAEVYKWCPAVVWLMVFAARHFWGSGRFRKEMRMALPAAAIVVFRM